MTSFLGWLMVCLGLAFFTLGTLALLRFPDVYTRLHALTKADNLGLGFITLGLAIQAESVLVAIKLILIWLLIMLASASVSHFIARAAKRHDQHHGAVS